MIDIGFQFEEPEIIRTYVSEFLKQKPLFSNCFLTDFTSTEFFRTNKSILVRKAYNSFFRTYLISTDPSEIKSVLTSLNGNYYINIPSKTEILNWNELLIASGFELVGVYERFYNNDTQSNDSFTALYANLSHFDKIKSYMYGYFNPVTDWLPDDQELERMIENKQVLINVQNNELKGFIIYTFEKNKFYLNCWYDISKDGMYLLYNVYALMKLNNIKYHYFWINTDNKTVKKIHSLHGAKPDGLKDYTYYKTNNPSK
jgi:hypothetical protein